MFHDKQARDEKKRIYGYMVLTIIYMNTNFPDSVPVNKKNKKPLIALSLYVLLYIIFKIKIKFQQSSTAGKYKYHNFFLERSKVTNLLSFYLKIYSTPT